MDKYSIGDKVDTSTFSFICSDIKENDEVYNRIIGKTYVANNDISLDDLVYIKLLHYNYDGDVVVGEVIVNKLIQEDIKYVFEKLFNLKYEINSMRLIDDYWISGDDSATDRNSILHNNSSSFYYRRVKNQNTLSNHALGLAIDINPIENPYTPRNKDGSFDTSLLTEYELDKLVNRDDKKKENKHIITLDDEICRVFSDVSFECGGIWPLQNDAWSCDWQHFEPVEEKQKRLILQMYK